MIGPSCNLAGKVAAHALFGASPGAGISPIDAGKSLTLRARSVMKRGSTQRPTQFVTKLSAGHIDGCVIFGADQTNSQPMESLAHILVIDDHREMRDLLARYLAKHGFRVSTAESAARARRLQAVAVLASFGAHP